MSWNSRRQICLDFKSDIVILLESVYKGFGLSRSLHVLTIINRLLMSLSQWGVQSCSDADL